MDIVQRAADARELEKPPLLILESVQAFLDEHALGSGPVRATRIGPGGGSNFSFLLERGEGRFVLRRPPRPPLPPSAHDMVREARFQLALAPQGIRLPRIRAVCEDESVLGVPFYVMDFLDGHILTDTLPPGLETKEARRRLGLDVVDALVEIHEVDVSTPGVAEFVRPGNYLERQLRRFSQLWEINQTRDLPEVEGAGRLLAERLPEPLPSAVVHGDYRIGNLMVSADDSARIVAILDWEMGAIGDPRADVGYLLAMYSEPGGDPNPLNVTPATATPGFPTKRELIDRYSERSGRGLERIGWFQGLALWKAAVFCEAIYGRYVRGELAAEDAGAARLEAGVPLLARTALELIEGE